MKRLVGPVRACALVVAGFAVVSPGCATVVGGAKDQKVTITSDPPGAAVLVDGQSYGVTPAEVPLSRKTEHVVQLQHPGYEPVQVSLKRTLNPWLLGNVVVGGFLGIVVDVCTGATHSLSPDTLNLKLQRTANPTSGPSTPGSPTISQ